MKKQFLLIISFVFFTLPPLFGQYMNSKRIIYDKVKQEKADFGDTSLTKNNRQCAQTDILDIGYQIGVGDYKNNRFFLNALWGYQIRPHFSLGYGGGMRYYHDQEAILIPFLTEFRFDFSDKTALPFLAMRIGHSLEITDSEYFKDAGFLLNFSLGYNFNISNNILFNMEAGYAFQEADIYGDSGLHNNIGLGAISISVGVILF